LWKSNNAAQGHCLQLNNFKVVQWNFRDVVNIGVMGRKFMLGTSEVSLDNISRHNIGFEGPKIGFEVNSQIQKAGVPNTVSQKGMLLYDHFQC